MTITKEFIDFGGTVYTFEKVDKMERTKENAFLKAVSIFVRSWTFAKLTESEKQQCINSLLWAKEQNILKGTFENRVQILNAVYNAFLAGVGYTSFNWRE